MKNRIWGLDLLRAAAVVAVVLYHYTKAPEQIWFRAISHFGWIGVDLFFVLSGYLIAGQLFSEMSERKAGITGRFYLRRFFRTLPNYYVVLGIYLFLVHASHPGLWKHFFFVHNFEIPQVFSNSWSLCVEEQFYLLAPLLFLAGNKIFSNKKALDPCLLAVFVVVIGALVRFLIWRNARPDIAYAANVDHGFEVYLSRLFYPTYVRLDGLIVGVTLAALRVYHPNTWRKWGEQPNFFLATGGVILVFALACLYKRMSMASAVFGYPLLALGFGAILVSSLQRDSLLCRWKIPGVPAIAALSYAIYLTHVLAIDAAEKLGAKAGFSNTSLATGLLGVVAVITYSAALYFVVERPFMKMRDRVMFYSPRTKASLQSRY